MTLVGTRAGRAARVVVDRANRRRRARQAFAAERDLASADELRPDGVRITESLRNGLSGFAPDSDVLVVASDLPVLTLRGGRRLRSAGRRASTPTSSTVASRKACTWQRFPEVPHTWARLRDGTFCGGGLAAIKPRALPLLERFIERLGAARKHPFKLASLFGWDMLARFAVGRLSIAQAEARGSKILGAPVRALVSPYPETGVNVDRVSDVALAERLLS